MSKHFVLEKEKVMMRRRMISENTCDQNNCVIAPLNKKITELELLLSNGKVIKIFT